MGAGAAGLLLPLGYLIAGYGPHWDLFSTVITVLLIFLAVAGARAGAMALGRVGPKALNSFPAPFLVTLGFVLGALIVAIGAIYLVVRVVGELASAFSSF